MSLLQVLSNLAKFRCQLRSTVRQNIAISPNIYPPLSLGLGHSNRLILNIISTIAAVV